MQCSLLDFNILMEKKTERLGCYYCSLLDFYIEMENKPKDWVFIGAVSRILTSILRKKQKTGWLFVQSLRFLRQDGEKTERLGCHCGSLLEFNVKIPNFFY